MLTRATLLVTLVVAVMATSRVTVAAAAAPGLVVVELFTSEGCSSCPPADEFLAELARRPDVLALSFHVTYWNDLGWADPFSLPAATERQRFYASRFGNSEVYTPQMVVNGAKGFVGSSRTEALAAIAAAQSIAPAALSIRIDRGPDDLAISLGGGGMAGRVLLVGFDAYHRTHIGRGENGGLDLRESDIVRSITVAARYDGAPLKLRQPVPAGEQFAALLQAGDGRIVGAARAALASSVR